jgi:UV DNA damage endonuclease
MPQFHGMVAESDAELRMIGEKAKQLGIRLSFHPSQYVLLNSSDPELTRKSVWDLSSQAEMLDRMGCGPEAVLVTHVGGIYGDPTQSRARWASVWPTLPEHVRRRLVLEHDDTRFSAADVLWIHEHTGVRLIFDYQHFWCLNPERLDMVETVRRILATWPPETRAKLHYSSPRTEFRALKRRDKATKRLKSVSLPPIWTGHADFINPFEFARFMRDCDGLAFDVMLEAKAKDLSLMKLRPDLLRYAPDVAARFGVHPDDAVSLEAEEAELEAVKTSSTDAFDTAA